MTLEVPDVERLQEHEQGALPEGWVCVPLSQLASVNGRDAVIRDLPDDLSITFVPMAAVDAETGTITKPQERPLFDVRKGFTPFSEGDVIFAKITPCMENGKAAIARGLTNGYGFGSTEFHVIRPGNSVIPEWLFYYVRQSSFREEAKANFSGTAGQLRVPSKFLENYFFPIPPLPEQHRIVAKIEELFSELDAGVANLKRVKAALKRYRASVLKAACEGKLVAQDPSDEPASQLLERILAERRAKWADEQRAKGIKSAKVKYEEPAPPDVEGRPGLAKGWVWTTFDQLLLELKNGYFAGKPASAPPGIPLLRISAVRPLEVSFDSPRYLPTSELERAAHYLLQDGDLLFTRYNGSLDLLGVCGMVRNLDGPMLYPDKLIRARVPNELVSAAYLEVYFSTGIPRHVIESKVKSTAGQQGIAGSDLKAIPVALPPLSEQHRIIAEVERRISVVQELEATVEANLKRAERLRQSILKRAFEGKLVEQDPSDEPASVLLEKIRGVKAQTARGDRVLGTIGEGVAAGLPRKIDALQPEDGWSADQHALVQQRLPLDQEQERPWPLN